MTNREKEILKLIKEDPMISQNELANILNITRSSVAVHITNLLKKGYILGKGYIVTNGEEYVTVVGGANIDIQGFPYDKIIFKDSNPGNMRSSLGGVGRNIAENIVKLGIETKLISILGDDIYGNKILEHSKKIGLDMKHTLVMSGKSTSTYLSLLDESGDMAVAMSCMDIFNDMKVDFLIQKKDIIQNSRVCVIDTNMPREVIEHIVMNYKNTSFFLDTVSTTKAKKILDLIGYFHTIKPNKIEAETLSGIKINSEDDLDKVGDYFLNKGVRQVFITLGKDGVYYCDETTRGNIKANNIKVVNATGAGDAFVAGLVYSYINDFNIKESAKFATGASILALSHEDTINPNMSVENINKTSKEIELC